MLIITIGFSETNHAFMHSVKDSVNKE